MGGGGLYDRETHDGLENQFVGRQKSENCCCGGEKNQVLTRVAPFRILELLSFLQASMSVCRRARFWGPGGGGRRDGDSGVEPSKRHHSSAGCHEAGPTRLRHVTHLLAPSAPQFHSEPRRPRKAHVRRDFKSNVNTRVSSSFPFSVLLASPETLITPGNNRGNSWSREPRPNCAHCAPVRSNQRH